MHANSPQSWSLPFRLQWLVSRNSSPKAMLSTVHICISSPPSLTTTKKSNSLEATMLAGSARESQVESNSQLVRVFPSQSGTRYEGK